MTHASRPQWWLFCLALLMALAVAPLKSQTPALTTISDTVFRANGSPASGILLISWPAFSTAGGATAADLGFASKADLVGGLALVVGELGSGSANSAPARRLDLGRMWYRGWRLRTYSGDASHQVRHRLFLDTEPNGRPERRGSKDGDADILLSGIRGGEPRNAEHFRGNVQSSACKP